MRYEWFIAKRYLHPQGGATFIFHLTLISMAGVALGVASLITVLSVMNGFGNDLREKILQGQSHLIVHFSGGLSDYQPLLPQLHELDNVAGAMPVIDNQGLAINTEFGSGNQIGTQFLGINPEQVPPASGIETNLIAGSLDGLRASNLQSGSNETVPITAFGRSGSQANRHRPPGIIIGKEMAHALFGYPSNTDSRNAYKQYLGYRITLIAPHKQVDTVTESIAQDLTFVVEGVFETGHFELDYSRAYISMPAAQYLAGLSEKITDIQIWLRDYSESATNATWKEVYNTTISQIGHGTVRKWMDLRRAFFDALQIEKRTMDYILKIIILVATFNIIATLFMVVTEKTRDIGLLRAVGAGRWNIMKIFLLLGLLVGAIGALLGVAGGFMICSFIQLFPPELPGGGSIYYLKYLPCDMEAADFVGAALYTFCVSFLASIYPAVRASRLLPVEALRFS